MRVKRYIVDTMPEAMLKIRTELGNDAVILSTKELKTGGVLGMFRKKQIEVIAAIEKDDNKKATNKQVTIAPNLAVAPRAIPEAYRRTSSLTAASREEEAATLDGRQQPFTHSKTDELAEKSALQRDQKHDEFLTQSAMNEQRQQLRSQQAAAVEQPPSINTGNENKLFEEIHQLKLMMTKLSKLDRDNRELPELLQKIQNRLSQQEIDETLIEQWIDTLLVRIQETDAQMDDGQIISLLKEEMISYLQPRLVGGIEPKSRIIYMAGPTGVGKTTTIAKLAADQLFRLRRKVGFITSDTYRIAAVEQLRTYASILNVPLEVVQSPADLNRAMERLQDCDLILMDTAGRNYRNEMLVSELQSLLSHHEDSETYLVLSLTSKIQDMKTITEHFSQYNLDKVILTKLDETGTYGTLFNLIQTYPLHISYITNGQNVPDDLLLPDASFFIDLILGEDFK
ncbi:flagellar biosynthesis protein FlhF [Paenibacillus sediminis]|uniref:Flagellar biosynthesis protein FlhF n=1 Tax=Paenibacillus sediminis TaxID=664909 RepID=A0ABS4H1K0_9BACL|nr:flagellar biosynthesis protein FlhF [Paenibacillus sediminis]MBP1936407.1 flagellar biosynthesis protein FlhF [Paenibacillus sediminis]